MFAVADGSGAPNLNIHLGDKSKAKTSIQSVDFEDATLEEMIERLARKSAARIWRGVPIKFQDSYEVKAVTKVHVKVEPKQPIELIANPTNSILRLEFDMGIECLQSRIQIDRAESYRYAVAVVDYVTQKVQVADASFLVRLCRRAP